jgi:hypothetical protein
MASGDTGNVVPGNRLRVRLPCPPLFHARDAILAIAGLNPWPDVVSGGLLSFSTTVASKASR